MAPPTSPPKITTRSQKSTEESLSVQELATNETAPKQLAPKPDKKSAEAFRSDLSNVRSSVTCTICDQLLYEPWILACGHTYCYSCLCSWFLPNKRKKTCPDCRRRVKHLPAPNYLIKQIVETFVNHVETMPADETIEQHQERRQEENNTVETDKASSTGLFKGCFTHQPHGTLVFNEEDRLYRCSRCSHEYNGGLICDVCDLDFDPDEPGVIHDDLDDRSSIYTADSMEIYNMEQDLEDSEVDYTDEEDAEAGLDHFHPQNQLVNGNLVPTSGVYRPSPLSNVMPPYSPPTWGDMPDHDHETDSDDDDDDDNEGSLSDFIEHDEDPHHHHVHSDDHASGSSDSEEDSDEGGAISNGRRRARGAWAAALVAARHLGFGSSTASPTASNSDTGAATEDENAAMYLHGGGWSPLDNGAESEYGEHEPIMPRLVRTDSSDAATDDHSDSDTIGDHPSGSDSEENSGRNDGSVTPQRHSPSPGTVAQINDEREGFYRGYGNGAYEREVSTDHHASDHSVRESTVDREGDTEMSVSPPALSAIDQSNRISRETSVEYLGTANAVHDIDDEDSSDASVLPAVRRRPRRDSRSSLTPEYNPRISMMFARHQSDLRDATQRDSPYFEDPDQELARERASFLAVAGGEPPDIRPTGSSRNRILPTRRAAVYQQHTPRQTFPGIIDRLSGPVIMPSSSSRPNRVQRQYVRR